VHPKDTLALEQAILRLAQNRMLQRACGEAARKRMREEFSIEAMVEKHIELYQALLNGQRDEEQQGQREGQPGAAQRTD
jgi:glycosyltransferase involved in cell wall biosynthesis